MTAALTMVMTGGDLVTSWNVGECETAKDRRKGGAIRTMGFGYAGHTEERTLGVEDGGFGSTWGCVGVTQGTNIYVYRYNASHRLKQAMMWSCMPHDKVHVRLARWNKLWHVG